MSETEPKKMICPYCNLNISFEEDKEVLWNKDENEESKEEKHEDYTEFIDKEYGISYGHCPACEKLVVFYKEGEGHSRMSHKGADIFTYFEPHTEEIIFPKYSTKAVELEVPERYKKDFLEANAVLSISPKASAALSRRILQDVFRGELGINKPSLAQEIEEFIKKKDVPTYLTDAVDAIRNIGNFAAHPLKDTNTGEIVEVEAGEAEWLLEVNEALFDFVFVQPKRLAERKKNLNAKLKSLGKPRMKK